MDSLHRGVWQRSSDGYFIDSDNELSGSDLNYFNGIMDNFRDYVNSFDPQSTLQNYTGNKFPCFPRGNKIEIDLDCNFGRLVRAKQSIDFDEEVYRSAPFAAVVESTKYAYCLTCNKVPTRENDAFIQCHQYQLVFFCCLQCMEVNQCHKFECRTCFHFINDIDTKLAIQMVLEAMTLFGTVQQMQNYIEKIVDEENFNRRLPNGSFDKLSRFDCIMRLHSFDVDHNLYRTSCIAYNLIMQIPVINVNFRERSEATFLKHLLMHFLGVIVTNAFAPALVISTKPEEIELHRLMIFDIFSLFNHSCCPNVKYYFKNNSNIMIGRTNHRINRNDQLFISYSFCYYRNTAKRRAKIQRNWRFRCHCNRCENKTTMAQFQKSIHPKIIPNLANIMKSIDMTDWNGQNCAYILSYMMNVEPKQLN